MSDSSRAAAFGETYELPLVELPGAHPCARCGECCHYVAVEIDNPASFTEYDQIHWYLTHRDVSVYVDWEGSWFIEFKTACEHFTPSRTCGIYTDRPKICSDFSWNECEVTLQEPAWKHRFTTPDEMHAWHRKHRPASFRRYEAARERLRRRRLEAGRKLARA